MRILLVDDDEAIAKALAKALTEQRHIVNIATDGQVGWDLAQSYTYDLIVLDIMLPKLDGVSLCQQLRRAGYQMPILLLTARDTHTDKVKGLDAGADDYVVKPFDWSELLARIRALLRREGQPLFSVLQWGELCLNPATCDVTYKNHPLTLRPKEYSLLELFLRSPRRIFSCGAILEHLWSFEDSPSEETVRAHIKGLRQKLKTVGVTDFIETVYGLGYRLKNPGRGEREMETLTPSFSPSTLQEALAGTWETLKPRVLEQVSVLEQANRALQAGTLSLDRQQQAKIQAHKLAGLVGSFGFSEASKLSRQIEDLLETESSLQPNQAECLQKWVFALRQEFVDFPICYQYQQATQAYQQAKKKHEEVMRQSEKVKFNLKKIKSNLGEIKKNFSELVNQVEAHQRTIQALPSIPVQGQDRQIDKLAAIQVSDAKILIVNHHLQMLSNLKNILEPWGFLICTLADPIDFWNTLETESPDLLILDLDMPELKGIELCQMIRNNTYWAGLPVIFLTADTDRDRIQQMFVAGADDFASKPIIGSELVTRIMSCIERSRLWRRLAEVDTLTQLANRTKFTAELHRLLQIAKRLNQPLCLAVLCLDNLKQINYQYGYGAGDTILRRVGELLDKWFGEQDVVARWSGNKFVVGMYGLNKTEGNQRLTQFLEILHQEIFTTTNYTQFQVMFSKGIAYYPLSRSQKNLKITDSSTTHLSLDNNNLWVNRFADFEALYRAAEVALDQEKTAK